MRIISASTSDKNVHLSQWVADFEPRARAQGISSATFKDAFAAISYDQRVIEKDRHQNEFVKPIWEYLDTAVSGTRIAQGMAALKDHAALLNRIEAQFGVNRHVVVAIWGMESNYGADRGNLPLIQSLATLSCDGRRGTFFEKQLVAALRILQAGNVTAKHMTGSWAGAMGHTQFMPTSYLEFAVDFDGDGRRDIWSDDPTDALASCAAYLAQAGWRQDENWAVEVAFPSDFDYALAARSVFKPAATWTGMGIRDIDGNTINTRANAWIFLPAGVHGAAFMVFTNFAVIEKYNSADAYVLAVGHLADRLSGGAPIRAGWPREDRPMTLSERQEMQDLLSKAGFDAGVVDGKIGPNTVAALRKYQLSIGWPADGYPSFALLEQLR